MPNNIERLKIALEEWLIRNQLDTDSKFYDASEWQTRGEPYLNDAELILVFEGGLHTMLSFGGDADEFEDYVESFGYYYELGHSWNMGFYPIPDYDYQPHLGTYKQKLEDARWQKKSKRVKERAGWKCQDCGSPNTLETHHCYYTTISSGHEPWEYPLSALRCLCRTCHESRAKKESRMRAYMARLTGCQIDALRDALDQSFYWFEADAVITLLSKLRHNDDNIYTAVEELLMHRNEDT